MGLSYNLWRHHQAEKSALVTGWAGGTGTSSTGRKPLDGDLVHPTPTWVNASFQPTNKKQNLSLVDAAYRDIVDAMKSESLIEGLDDSTTAPGSLRKDSSTKSRAERAEEDEQQRAAAYAENIRTGHVWSQNFACGSLQAHEGESRRPDKRKKEGRKTKQQEKLPHKTYQQTQKGELPGQPFQVTFLTDIVKKCYGCKRTFAVRLRKIPNNVILNRLDRKEFMDTDGKRRQRTQLQKMYYHLNLHCVERNYT